MRMALFAGMSLNSRALVDDDQLLGVRGDADFIAGNNCNDREFRTCGFPAFAAATGMIVQGLSVNPDFNLIGRTQALQGTAREICSAWLYAIIQ
jgi:hypothetical protein